jgi:hypothetical protein
MSHATDRSHLLALTEPIPALWSLQGQGRIDHHQPRVAHWQAYVWFAREAEQLARALSVVFPDQSPWRG